MDIAADRPILARRLVWWLVSVPVRALRPALFLALAAGAVWYGWHGAVSYEARTGWSPQTATLERRVERAFRETVPEGAAPGDVWLAALRGSLDPARLPQPDLDLARSLAGALDPMVGRERLALAVLSEAGTPAAIEAELRARPDWQRRRRLDRALEARLEEARQAGLEPPELVFADPLVRERFAAADRLYARTLAGMEAWFADPAGRTLRLDRVPGWAGRLDRPVELRGGVQGLIAEACAALRDTPRATGACETGFIVKPAPDPAALNLAALAAALEADALEAGGGAAAGARLLLAARKADIMHPELAGRLAGDAGGQARLLGSLAPFLEEAGEIYSQPVRSAAELGAAAGQGLAGTDVDGLTALAAGAAELRRRAGTGAALRLLAAVRTPHDLDRLNALAGVSGPQTLALFHLHADPEGLLDLADGAPRVRPEEIGAWRLSAGLAALALLLALSAPLGAHIEAATGTGSGLRAFANRTESLILRKKL